MKSVLVVEAKVTESSILETNVLKGVVKSKVVDINCRLSFSWLGSMVP